MSGDWDDLHDKNWTVYLYDEHGFPKIVMDNASEWESWARDGSAQTSRCPSSVER